MDRLHYLMLSVLLNPKAMQSTSLWSVSAAPHGGLAQEPLCHPSYLTLHLLD